MMESNNLKYFFSFILLVFLQALVLNHISFLNYASPFLYIYFIIKLPVGINRNLVMFLGFLLGFVLDIFCNTPGLNASATTLAAFVRRPLQDLFFPREDFEHLSPKLSVLGSAFVKYTISMVVIHHFALLTIESFTYYNFDLMLLRILMSSALTLILIFAIEGLSLKKKKQ